MNDQAVSIRLSPELHTWLKARARSEFRTMQAEALKILSDAMKEAPYIPSPEPIPFASRVPDNNGVFADMPMRVRGGAA